jgi:prophage antirepressor-like protein
MNALTPAILAAPTTDTSTSALIFRFGQHPIRVIVKDGEPWFVAKDVCDAVKLANAADALLKLDDDEKGVGLTDTPGGPQHVSIISESGLYMLILRCRGATTPGTLPHQFRRFVTAEVLPEIRRRGSYGAPGPDLDDNQVLRRLLLGKLEEVDTLRATAEAERQARLAAEQEAVEANQDFLDTARVLTIVTHRAETATARVEALQPKALAYDRLSAARKSKLISDYAKDVKVAPSRMFKMLDDRGWIFRRGTSNELRAKKGGWLGTSYALGREFIEHDTDYADTIYGIKEKRQVMITAKGQAFLDAELAQGKLALSRPRARKA